MKVLKKLKDAGVQIKESSPKGKGLPLEGKTFVFTGELENYTRAKATALVESLGGRVSSSVSSKVNFVVVGEEPGSKLTKAKALNVPTLTETEFMKMVQ